jgi:hypothetical protein
MSKINLNSLQTVKPVKSTTIYSCKTGQVFINENWKVFFTYEKEPDQNFINELNEQIESLENNLEKLENVFEIEQLKREIARVKRKLEYAWTKTRYGHYFVMLEQKQVLDFQDCLQNAREPENIWSCLFNTWLRFWTENGTNNLWKVLTDNQIDNMTGEQAISWEQETDNRFPRTREEE